MCCDVLLANEVCVGDIVLFDGDVPHRGVEYISPCAAMHLYMDVPEVDRITDRV